MAIKITVKCHDCGVEYEMDRNGYNLGMRTGKRDFRCKPCLKKWRDKVFMHR